jgi:hypothetical protein
MEAISIQSVFQVVEAIAVTFGVVFAVVEWQRHTRQQEREAALELLHSFQTPDFAKALLLVYELPDEELSKKQIEERFGEDMHLVYALTTTWESLGVLVFRREIKLELVSDFFSGPIRISWNKLGRYFADEREQHQRETIGEWFQWLAERLEENEATTPRVAAHIAHKNWVN